MTGVESGDSAEVSRERLRLVFVRHGRARDVDGRCIGQTDVPLSDRGREEIRQLSSALAAAGICVDRVISSDLARARESAALIADVVRRPVEIDSRLREMAFGDWDGRPWAEIERDDGARYAAWMADWLTLAPPGGETVSELARRADEWTSTLESVSQTLIVVAHAGWIRAAVTRLLGRAMRDLFALPVDHARMTIVDVTPTGAALVASNVAGADTNR